MDVSTISSGTAGVAAAPARDAGQYTVAVMAMAQRQQKQEAAGLISLLESVPATPGVGQRLSVYA